MYSSSRSPIRAANFAAALPLLASSSTCVSRTRTNEYSAATKNPLARTRRIVVSTAGRAALASIQRHSRTDRLREVRVLVRLFASYREAAGVGHIELDLPLGAKVRDAIAEIAKRHPLITEGRKVVIARNRDYVTPDEPLADGDEVALIPPVSGGDAGIPAVLISSHVLSVDDALAAARDDGWGGVVVFLGTVRDTSRGKRVTHLEYEAYPEMAEAKMREIAGRLEAKHAPCRLVLHHRIGDLAIGDVAVVIVAGAPHRGAAFTAAREAIDELKTIVPIWKKEHAEDGAIWVEEHA